MFTLEGIALSAIVHKIKMDRLRLDNMVLPRNTFKTAGTDNAMFYIDENVDAISSSINDYNIGDLRPTDDVLDIGANIGGFSLNIYKKVNHVYAVEPLFIEVLNRNIELNNAKNIDVIPCALGSGEFDITYNGRSRKVIGLPLGNIIKLCGGHIDFLKCDCEGGEWSITLPEIMNIRRIEAEVHNFGNTHNFKDFEDLLTSSGFDYTKRLDSKGTLLMSAKNKYID